MYNVPGVPTDAGPQDLDQWVSNHKLEQLKYGVCFLCTDGIAYTKCHDATLVRYRVYKDAVQKALFPVSAGSTGVVTLITKADMVDVVVEPKGIGLPFYVELASTWMECPC